MATWLILGIFVIMVLLMYTKRLPAMLALPVMAVAIAAVAGVPWGDVKQGDKILEGIATGVLTGGATRLAAAYAMVMFGAALGQFIKKTGIAENIIRKAAELSGDRPLVLGIVMTLAIAAIFTTLGGLGSVIMVGTIVLPILMSVGIPPLVAGSILLFGLSLGGIFNLINWGLYTSVLKLTVDQVRSFAIIFGAVFAVTALTFLVLEMRKGRMAWAVNIEPPTQTAPKINPVALLTPLVPLILVLFLKWQIIPAFMAGLLFGVITTWRKDVINILTRSVIEGIADGAPAIFLMVGIGMLLKAVLDPRVTSHIGPVVAKVLPSSPIGYVIFFTVLAPLALYRGPLNLWGLGLGIAALMMQSGALPATAIMAALLTVGQIQGVCDPTNTHNVWTATYVGVDVNDILRKTIPYVWASAFVGLVIAAVIYL